MFKIILIALVMFILSSIVFLEVSVNTDLGNRFRTTVLAPLADRLQGNSLSRWLNLTDYQTKTLRLTKESYHREDSALTRRIDRLKSQLNDEMKKSDPDMDRLTAECNDLGQLYAQKVRLRILYKLIVSRRILRPDQLAKWENWQPNHPTQVMDVALGR